MLFRQLQFPIRGLRWYTKERAVRYSPRKSRSGLYRGVNQADPSSWMIQVENGLET
jgi:hypothetical protein